MELDQLSDFLLAPLIAQSVLSYKSRSFSLWRKTTFNTLVLDFGAVGSVG